MICDVNEISYDTCGSVPNGDTIFKHLTFVTVGYEGHAHCCDVDVTACTDVALNFNLHFPPNVAVIVPILVYDPYYLIFSIRPVFIGNVLPTARNDCRIYSRTDGEHGHRPDLVPRTGTQPVQRRLIDPQRNIRQQSWLLQKEDVFIV